MAPRRPAGGAGTSLLRRGALIDQTAYDIAALERDGNLPVLPIDAESRAVVTDLLETGESSLLDTVLAEYLMEPP